MSDAWEKRFQQRTPFWIVILFTVLALLIGGLFLFLDSDSSLAGRPTLFTWIGLGVVVGFPLLAWLIYHFRTNVDIICRPDGFTLLKETRHGKTEEHYSWNDVTGTHYSEMESTDKDDKTTVTYWYEVHSSAGKLFQVPGSIRRFDDLIQTFNQWAVNVPYVWQKQTGFNVSIMGLGVRRARYVQAPREAAAQ